MMFVGPSGCGKSTLALELIQDGATLIADDQVILSGADSGVIGTCPEFIRHKLHMDGIGILHLNSDEKSPVDYIFQSDLPPTKLSCVPELAAWRDIPVITMDFKAAGSKQFVVNTLTSFDSPACIP